MALRAYWSGDLAVGPIVVPVQAGKATQADERDEQLKRLCSCHHQPFKRPADTCPGGMHPYSDAAAKRGDEDLTDVVYGVPVDEDGEEWQVIDDDVLEEIKEVAQLEDLEIDPGDVVHVEELPSQFFVDAWYVWPQVAKGKKGQKRIQTFAGLIRALEASELALVTIWTPRANQAPRLVALHPVGDALVMNVMPFRPEVRDPTQEDKIVSHADVQLPNGAVEMVQAILQEMRGEFKYSAYEDITVARRRKAIDEALEGKEITKPKKAAPVEEPDEEPDLMAALEASLAAVKNGDVKPRKELIEA